MSNSTTNRISGTQSRSGTSGEPLLRVEGLRKYFPIKKGLFSRHVGDVKAVDGVSFDIYPNETLGVVGESGCGKTTVGRTVLRLLEPTAGSAIFEGKDVFQLGRPELRAMRRDMQIIFQDPYSSLNPRMTIGNIIGDALELHGLARGDERFDHAKVLLERVGLQASYINRYPHEFSGGQRQRIGIARAVALRPKFIVCDEAVSALDVSVQAQVLNLLMDLQQDFNLSYMFIAHDLSVVRHSSKSVAVMYLGRIVELSDCDDLYEAPLHPYTQALLSAIPHPDPTRKAERVILQGDVPTPIHPPSGCHFHTRCPLAFDRCSVDSPSPREVRPGHQVACHLYDDASLPAEPVWIGEVRAARSGQSRAAGVSHSEAERSPGTEPAEPSQDDQATELASPDRHAVPAVLRDRGNISIGPFGEVVDGDESERVPVPSLESFVTPPTLDADAGASGSEFFDGELEEETLLAPAEEVTPEEPDPASVDTQEAPVAGPSK